MSPVSPFLAPERDGAFKRGRAKQGSTVYYVIPGVMVINTTLSSIPAVHNRDVFAPIFVDTPLVVDQLAMEVTTNQAATNIEFGIYRADTDWQPIGGPLADSGNVSSATTGVKTYTPGTPLYLPRGRYLTVHNTDDAADVVRTRSYTGNISHGPLLDTLGGSAVLSVLTNSRTYGAFPTPGTAWTTPQAAGTTALWNVVLRVLTP